MSDLSEYRFGLELGKSLIGRIGEMNKLTDGLLLIIVLVLCVNEPCRAQVVVNVYDNNGILVGQPHVSNEIVRNHVVFRPDSIVVSIDFYTGEVFPQATPTIWFDENNCEGNPYMALSPTVFDVIMTSSSRETPKVLFLSRHDSVYEEVELQSKNTINQVGCDSEGSITKFVTPVTIISDPSEYGFIITPTGNWGYAAPLKTKVIIVPPLGEIISCDGFESCPAL